MNKLKAFWASLPHQVQAGVILFGTVAGTTLAKELQALAFGTLSFSVSSLEHDLGMAIFAGFVAVRAFYCEPNRTPVAGSDSK
jgi:predicted Na+-dependent transporter